MNTTVRTSALRPELAIAVSGRAPGSVAVSLPPLGYAVCAAR